MFDGNFAALFDPDRTGKQLFALASAGLQQSEPMWNLGFPKLTASFPTLKHGLWYVLAPENVGKSMFQLNVGYNVLQHNESAYWLDFSLDDSVEDRLAYLMARAGGLPIDLIVQAGNATVEEKLKRKTVFEKFHEKFAARYHLFGIADQSEDEEEETGSFSAQWITRMVTQARKQVGPDAKLFVTVDSFHDVDLEATGVTEENDKLSMKSKLFKRSASRTKALYLMTAHTRKDSRKRGMTADILWGVARLLYDAKIMTALYSDVNLNYDKASVFWNHKDKPGQLMPVHELNILKNKVGGYKGYIFYNYYPHTCLDVEVDAATQSYYKDCVFGKKG